MIVVAGAVHGGGGGSLDSVLPSIECDCIVGRAADACPVDALCVWEIGLIEASGALGNVLKAADSSKCRFLEGAA